MVMSTKSKYSLYYYTILGLFLFLGLQKQVQNVINKCLLPIFSIEHHWALDGVLVLITIIFLGRLKEIIDEKKMISKEEMTFFFLLIFCYAYYRWDESVYYFIRCFDSDLAYLDIIALLGGLYVFYGGIMHCIKGYINGKNNGDKKAVKNVLAPTQDAPIKDIGDDKFGMQEHVNRVVSYLKSVDVNNKAFSIGVVGSWGYGKSSFFNFVKKEIEKDKEFIVMDFNPRTSKEINHIQEDFLNGLRECLKPFHSNLNRVFEEYAIALNITTDTSPIFSFLLKFFKIQSKGWKESYDSIDLIIREVKKRIVVFVDDLDRLTAKELLEVLKVIDKNGAFNHVIFVSAYDKDYVNNALKAYLRHDVKCPYTDKYFDVEIKLPKHAFHLLMDYLQDLLKKAGEVKQGLLMEEEMRESIKDAEKCLRKRLHTIRDVKRFINQFLYDYPAVQTEVNFRDYFLLELIKFSHKEEYNKLRDVEYLNAYQDSGTDTTLYYLSPSLYDRNNKLEVEVLDILEKLFPSALNDKFDGTSGRICNTNSFDIYFYNNEYNHILQNDFNSLYVLPLSDCCDKLDSWIGNHQENSPHSADVLNYLTSRHLPSMGDIGRLKIYFQLLLYLQGKSEAFGYWTKLKEFFQKEDAQKNISQYAFEDKRAYLDWMKDTMLELFDLKKNISINIFPKIIDGVLKDKNFKELLMFECHELQHAALLFLEDYLQKIDSPDWDAKMAFDLSAIHSGDNGLFYVPAMESLRKSIKSKPKKFYPALLPVIGASNKSEEGWISLDYVSNFHFLEVFPDFGEFQDLLDKDLNEQNENIIVVKKFSRLFMSNSFKPLNLKLSTESLNEIVHHAYERLLELELFAAELKFVHNRCSKANRLKEIDSCQQEYDMIKRSVNNVDLSIEYKELVQNKIEKYSFQLINHYKKICGFSKNMVVGDFVKIKDDCLLELQDQKKPNMDSTICKIEKILPGGLLELDLYNGMIPTNSVEAIPINGDVDKCFYYDPVIAAATVNTNSPLPVYNTDYSYYLEHFKRCYLDKNKSYYDIVKEKEFEFVHEVQHWLRNMVGEDLKIRRYFNVFKRRVRKKGQSGLDQ